MKLSRSVSGSILGFIAALALAGALVPALASAQTYPYNNTTYYGNCGYSNSYPYTTGAYPYDPYLNNNYQYGNCPQGNLFVYLQVSAPVNSYYSQQPSNFTISISGATAYPQTFQGSANGRLVSVVGTYSVTAASYQGFTPSYSTGCSGTLIQNQQNTCVITETPIYPPGYYQNNYPYNNQYPYNTPYVAPYTQTVPTVYVTPTYVPKLANTGFEPLFSFADGGATLAFALVALIAMAFLSLPYVRKAFATILG